MTILIENEIAMIVLAGGESSRMGQDKALLRMGDTTLLSQICSIGNEIDATVYVVTPWIEKYRSILPSGCQLLQEKLILNRKSNTPIIGFVQALQSIETEWVLLLSCDLPYLSSSQVKQWLPGLTTVLPSEVAFLPRNHKGWEAICGFYRRSCLSSLESYIDSGGMSFQGWLAQHLVKELIVEDTTCLFNCNTPEDWQSIQ